jgi:Ca2+-binding EF-hand superfamily protein
VSSKSFEPSENQILRATFKNLSLQSNGSGIDKSTFLSYFQLPGLLGERLLNLFDENRDGTIDANEFITSLATCCRGSLDARLMFMFKLYDLNSDGFVSKEELTFFLNQLPKHETNFYNRGDNSYSSKVASKYTNTYLIEDAFKTIDVAQTERLTFEQFKALCQMRPEVIDPLMAALPYGSPACTELRQQNSHSILPFYGTAELSKVQEDASCNGYGLLQADLWKVSKVQRRWLQRRCVLCKGCVYLFTHKLDENQQLEPRSVLFLRGCVVRALHPDPYESSGYYGFVLEGGMGGNELCSYSMCHDYTMKTYSLPYPVTCSLPIPCVVTCVCYRREECRRSDSYFVRS